MAVIISDDDGVAPPVVSVPTFEWPLNFATQRFSVLCCNNANMAMIPATYAAALNGPHVIVVGIGSVGPTTIRLFPGEGFFTCAQPRAFYVPSLLWGNAESGKSQFSEYRVTLDSSVIGSVIRCGPAVFALQVQSYNSGGYLLVTRGESLLMDLVTDMGPGVGTTVGTVLHANMAFAIGEVLRLEVMPAATFNTLNVYRNGALTFTMNDASGGRPKTGFPGYFIAYCDGPGIRQESDYMKAGFI